MHFRITKSEQTNREQAVALDDADDKLFTWEMKEHFFMFFSLSHSFIRVCLLWFMCDTFVNLIKVFYAVREAQRKFFNDSNEKVF